MTPEVELRLTANLDEASREIVGFRKEFAKMAQEVEKPLRQTNTFRDLSQSLEGTQRQIGNAKDRLRQLRDEIVRTEAPSKELQADYRNATNELKRLERQELSQIGQLRSHRAELRAAGVDVANLASEQRRLSAELEKRMGAGRADAALAAARNALGVGEIESAQRQLLELRQQYRLVTSDGNLSAKQRAEAEATYRRNVTDTLGRLRDLRAATAEQASAAQKEASATAQRQAQAKTGIAMVAAEQRKAAIAVRQAAIDSARNDLGVGRARELSGELQRLRGQYDLLRRTGGLTAKELAIAQQTLNRRIQETRQELRGLSDARGSSESAGGNVLSGLAGRIGVGADVGVAGGVAGVAAVSAIYAAAVDPIKKMDAQLQLATESQREFNRAQLETFRIAQENQAPLEDVVTLYSRLTPALREVGRGQDDALKIIEAVTKSLKISGATAAETASTIQQFSQALGSGVLRGEEFNTLAESSPRLLRALADGLNVGVGALRDMAAQGELTADVIADALIGQLPKLAEEAAKLPETFSGAVTKLKNEAQQMLREFDRIAGASNRVVAGINGITEAMSKLRSGEFLDFFRSDKATIAGFNSEISVLLSRMRDLENARNRLNNADPDDKVLFGFKFYTRAELDAALSDLQGAIDKLKAQRDQLEASEKQSFDFREERLRLHGQKLKANRQQQVKEAEAGNKQLIESLKKRIQQEVSAERAAVSEIAKIQKERTELEAKYKQAISGFSSSSADPSFGAANALKVSARNALQAGNIDQARSDAQAALEMLQELQQAGQNTYGFGGFAKELLAIEDAALGIEQSNAEQKLAAIKANIADLRAELDGIKDVKVTVSMSDAELQDVISKVEQLSAKIGKPIVIPIVYAHPDGPVAKDLPAPPQDYVVTNPTPPSFATGGIARGPGTGTSDSIWARISNGEGILTARAVQHYGSSLVHQINRLQLPRFATGGVIGERYSPAIPPINPSILASGQQGGGGNSVTINLPGGGSYTLQADNQTFDALVRNESRKYGRKPK